VISKIEVIFCLYICTLHDLLKILNNYLMQIANPFL